MKSPLKRFKYLAVSLLTGLSLTLSMYSGAKAGPVIDFGDQGYLQMDIKEQVYVEYTNIGSGANGGNPNTNIHFQRNRLTFTGMMDDTWGAKFQTCGNFGTDKTPLGYMNYQAANNAEDRSVKIIDAYIIGDFDTHLRMKLGLTKIPLTRANLTDCFAPLSLDRSMFVYTPDANSSAKTSRDMGLVLWGTFFDDKLKYWAGIFQGRQGTSNWTFSSPTALNAKLTPGATYESSPQPGNNFLYVLRAHYSFLDPEPGGSGYLGTYFGKKKILTLGAGVAYQPNYAYRDVNPNGTLIDKKTVDYKAYAADLFFEYPFSFGVLTLDGQYLKADIGNAYKNNQDPADLNTYVAGINGQKQGGYGKIAYMPPITLFEKYKDSKIQPYLLYEKWMFAMILGVQDQTLKQYGGGINFYIKGQNLRVTAEYLKTAFDKPTWLMGTATNSKFNSFNTYRMMFQIVF